MANKRRLFTFGCSFTEYSWPTWADILGKSVHQQGWEFHNMGRAGVGNMQIMKTILKAKQVYNFTPDDKLMVMWTSWNREDRYLPSTIHQGGWVLEGNVLNSDFYRELIDKYWSLEHDIINTWTAISASRQLVNLDFEGSIPPIEGFSLDPNSYDDPLLKEYVTLKMPNVLEDRFAVDSENPIDRFDGHPRPLVALEYVDNVITPATGISVTDEVRQWTTDYHAWMDSTAIHLTNLPNTGNTEPWEQVKQRFISRYSKEFMKFRYDDSVQNFWNPEDFLDYFIDIKKRL